MHSSRSINGHYVLVQGGYLPEGILASLRGTLVALAFGLVLSFGLGNGLPLDIAGSISPAALQGHDVIHNVPATFTCHSSSSGTWILPPEPVLRMVCPLNTASGISDTGLASLSGESRA